MDLIEIGKNYEITGDDFDLVINKAYKFIFS